ncbi:hypothetical protein B0T17DRAFT_487158 [Bombardia bombarda]|uniref:JmjC domain-containing protein n=1 Tax=Bombardia bombarda TaxID=252184 RepID=A0AA39X6Q4_9PEZI|nr:hypothetical protein B0T17DRAFT_487158 [Bombardia bombarda]
MKRANEAIETARDFIRTVDNPASKTRLQAQIRKYGEILGRCTPGKPITAAQYLAGEWKGATDHFVVCSSGEARSILAEATPLLPLLIPAELNTQVERLQLDRYLTILETRPTLDVHDFDAEGDLVVPERLESRYATALFRDESRGPINLLNLRGYKQNPTPSCLAGLEAYTILDAIQEESENGKAPERLLSDLSECARFQLCGNRGAFHLEHIDHHGTLTTTFSDDGEKLWPGWPGLRLEDILEWAQSGELPAGPCVGIYLGPGYLLVQPQAYLHAPLSLTDVLMTGTMHWDSRAMLKVMRLSKMEIQHPHITNEAPAKEFLGKINQIRTLWTQGHPAWPWGSEDELRQFSELVEWFSEGCTCETRCGKGCKCKGNESSCDGRCHPGKSCQNT